MTYPTLHLDDLQPAVELGHEVRRAGVGDSSSANKAVVEVLVLADTLAEGPALIVDRERGDLLGQSKEIDGGIKQTWLELGVEVDRAFTSIFWLACSIEEDEGRYERLGCVREGSNVHHRDDMQGELQEDGEEDVEVEDIAQRTLLRQFFNGLDGIINASKPSRRQTLTLAREMQRKQTDISMPVMDI
jgi:hypothetical protein